MIGAGGLLRNVASTCGWTRVRVLTGRSEMRSGYMVVTQVMTHKKSDYPYLSQISQRNVLLHT